MRKETRIKNKGMMRQRMSQNYGLGPVFCKECGLFFDDNRIRNYANYQECKQHTGFTGYSLYDQLTKGEGKHGY